jgi:hypothetical protein
MVDSQSVGGNFVAPLAAGSFPSRILQPWSGMDAGAYAVKNVGVTNYVLHAYDEVRVVVVVGRSEQVDDGTRIKAHKTVP